MLEQRTRYNPCRSTRSTRWTFDKIMELLDTLDQRARCHPWTFDEIVEHMKQVRQNNQMVFLYQVYQQTQRPEEIVIEVNGCTSIIPQDLSVYYVVCYGIIKVLEEIK